ncbi:MAG TPA: acetyltransferase [Desulfobulbaceae bacterium]|nr:acetyltransferase [Desulfobulbaceae bacterium]
MSFIDVFNGDADGICALHQLRLTTPRPEALLITGVKRDIGLLSRLQHVKDCTLTVLDISLDRNRSALLELLAQNNRILYIDHHYCGDLPAAANLETHIDPRPEACTSIIVDSLLQGRHRPWAIVGAFGDNLDEFALRLADSLALEQPAIAALKETGILLNYNGYGARLDDLYTPPDELYRQVSEYADPLLFHKNSPALEALRQGYEDDMFLAQSYSPVQESSHGRIFLLPEKPWARRVAGVFSNTLARQEPGKAHGLLMPNSDGTLRISVRAPLNNPTGADQLCRRFPTGGGRAAAAGVNNLPREQATEFMQAFMAQFDEASFPGP